MLRRRGKHLYTYNSILDLMMRKISRQFASSMANITNETCLLPVSYFLNDKSRVESTRFIDASWYMPASNHRNAYREFLAHRIPGAVYWNIDEICDKSSKQPHSVPSSQVIHNALKRFGICAHHSIVVYDNVNMLSSSTVWYTLKAYGIQRVAVLDGGFSAWTTAGLDTESVEGEHDIDIDGVPCQVQFDSSKFVSCKEVLDNISTQHAYVIDARSSARFDGKLPEPRPGLRSGHIPGSINIPFGLVLDNSQQDVGITSFKAKDDIRSVFTDAGVNLMANRPIILSCGSGVSACILACALTHIGVNHQLISVYNGSWSEWGDESCGTPVECT